VYYEVRAKQGLVNALTDEEKQTLRKDLEVCEPDKDLGDIYAAKIRASHMLARWRDDIEKAVDEGNDCDEYSSILKPGAKTEAEKLALTLVEFFRPPPCVATIDLTQTENKEVKKCENTVQILNGTALGDGITLTYYSSDSEEDDSVKGTATKRRKAKTNQGGDEGEKVQSESDDDISWFVVLANGQAFEVVEDDLKNTQQYKVHLPTNNQLLTCIADNKKHKQQRQWRQRKLQADKEEQFVTGEARKQMDKFWKQQWQHLAEICENPDRSLGWEECAAIFQKIAEPFKTKINGRDVTVNARDSAVLMRDLSLSRFADTILKQDESKEQESDQSASSRPKKRQKQNNNYSATVNTTLGADGYSALSQTQRRDTECINKQDATTSKKTTERIKWIEATLTCVTKHKARCEKEWQLLLAVAPDANPPQQS